MARPFLYPDPRDRSVNEPTYIASSNQVLGLYRQETGDKKERVVEPVRDWYQDAMLENGWTDAIFHGNQCVLTAKVVLENDFAEEDD